MSILWKKDKGGGMMDRLTRRTETGGIKYTRHNIYEENIVEKLAEYEDAEEQGLLLRLPCKVGDTVYVGSSALPIEDMECYEDVDNPIPQYFLGRVVSFRFAKINWMKIAVKAKWLYEWIDEETGPESNYIDSEKNFSFSLSVIGKTVFLTQAEAEQKLKEMENDLYDY